MQLLRELAFCATAVKVDGIRFEFCLINNRRFICGKRLKRAELRVMAVCKVSEDLGYAHEYC